MRRIVLSNTYNTRDLGGYPIGSQGQTRYGAFWRSDVPTQLNEEDVKRFLDAGMTTIVDLRFEGEPEHRPCYFADKEGFAYHHVAMVGNTTGFEDERAMPDFYRQMLGEKLALGRALKLLADAPGGAMYHCMAGKDRTGVISALLLWLCGVGIEDILADYQITSTYLRPFIRKYLEHFPQIPAYLLESRVSFMEGPFEELMAKYPDPVVYFAEAGLSNAQIAALRDKLIAR